MAQIHCPQKKIAFSADPQMSLMDNLLTHGVPVASSCRGDGICGKCAMKINPISQLQPPSELELKTLQRNQIPSENRLSCQQFITTDVEVFTTYW